MEQINEIYALYDADIQKVEDLEKNRKITAGLFGLTKGPEDDPCHDKFAEDMEAALKEVAAEADFGALRADTADRYTDDSLTYHELTALDALFNRTDEDEQD